MTLDTMKTVNAYLNENSRARMPIPFSAWHKSKGISLTRQERSAVEAYMRSLWDKGQIAGIRSGNRVAYIWQKALLKRTGKFPGLGARWKSEIGEQL